MKLYEQVHVYYFYMENTGVGCLTCIGVALEQMAVKPTMSEKSIVTLSTFRGATVSPVDEQVRKLYIGVHVCIKHLEIYNVNSKYNS